MEKEKKGLQFIIDYRCGDCGKSGMQVVAPDEATCVHCGAAAYYLVGNGFSDLIRKQLHDLGWIHKDELLERLGFTTPG